MEDPFNYVKQPDKPEEAPVNVPQQHHVGVNDSLARQRRLKKIAAIVIFVLFTVIAAAGIFFIFLRDSEPQPPAPNPAVPQGVPLETPEPEADITDETETHTSSRFFLEIAHPIDWQVEESADEGLTITSPQMPLPSGDTTTEGVIQLQVRSPKSKLPEFEAGNAVAVLASEKITYTNPSSAQRGDTYVSFATYANSNSALMDAFYITGDFGYKKGQAIPKVDVSKIDPIVRVRFLACDGACQEPIGVNPDVRSSEIGRAILAMLKSLKVN